MMNAAGPHIFDVSAENFQEKVLDASYRAPVIVDFWAEWCDPCKVLGPLLETVIASYKGAVALARADIDRNPQLAAQFGIRSVPTVKIFMNGEVADEFTGLLPERDIRAIIDALAGDEIEKLLEKAFQLAEGDRLDEAESVYTAVLERCPGHSGAQIGLARVKIVKGEDDAARALLGAIEESDERYGEARALLGLFEFVTICERNGGFDACRKAAEDSPGDLEARYNLGCCYAAGDSYRDAFEAFLAIVKKDRGFGEGKAQKAMLTLFSALGSAHELTGEFRKNLAMELF
jgi:putative thioredoxin